MLFIVDGGGFILFETIPGEIMVNRPQTLNRVVALFLVSVCAASLFIGNVRVQADDGYSGLGNGTSAIDKCSPDLLAIADTASATRVKVIVQSSTTSTRPLGGGGVFRPADGIMLAD